MSRIVVRIALGISLAAVVWIAVEAILDWRQSSGDSRAVMAALLAVIGSIVSAWASQRVVEFQEDQLTPNPVPEFDLYSRLNLAQLRITNYGGSPAYNVVVVWDRPPEKLSKYDGPIKLGTDGTIPVLMPGASASEAIGVSHDFFEKNADTTFAGVIRFHDTSGRRYSRRFVVSAEHQRRALTHDNEATKAYRELQKVPEVLERVRKEIAGIRWDLRQHVGSADPEE